MYLDINYIIYQFLMERTLKIPTKYQLLEMVKKEEKVRWSSWYQSECDRVKDQVNGWLTVSSQVQYQIVKDFGFDTDVESDIAVNHLRRARYLYPEEPLFQSIPVYVRNNLAKQIKYKNGDQIPNVPINSLDGSNQFNLFDILDKSKTNVIFGSSHT
jgi:hypothetical protein